jgi:hypothetical protein
VIMEQSVVRRATIVVRPEEKKVISLRRSLFPASPANKNGQPNIPSMRHSALASQQRTRMQKRRVLFSKASRKRTTEMDPDIWSWYCLKTRK